MNVAPSDQHPKLDPLRGHLSHFVAVVRLDAAQSLFASTAGWLQLKLLHRRPARCVGSGVCDVATRQTPSVVRSGDRHLRCETAVLGVGHLEHYLYLDLQLMVYKTKRMSVIRSYENRPDCGIADTAVQRSSGTARCCPTSPGICSCPRPTRTHGQTSRTPWLPVDEWCTR